MSNISSMSNINSIIENVQQKLIRKLFSQSFGDILINSSIVDSIKLTSEELNEIITQSKPKKRIVMVRKKKGSKPINESINTKIMFEEDNNSVEECIVVDKDNSDNDNISPKLNINDDIPNDIDPENWRYKDTLYLVDKNTNYVYCRKKNKLMGIRAYNEDREIYYIDSIDDY